MADALRAIGDAVIFFRDPEVDEEGKSVKRPPVTNPVVYAASEGAAFVMIDETGAMFMLPWDSLSAVSVYPRGEEVEDGETTATTSGSGPESVEETGGEGAAEEA